MVAIPMNIDASLGRHPGSWRVRCVECGVDYDLAAREGVGRGQKWTPEQVFRDLGHRAGWRVDRHPRVCADVTGDGRADIVGFGDTGVQVALAHGDGTFEPPRLAVADFGARAGGWRIDRHPRMLADLTGSGRADIVGFGDAGVRIALAKGDGSFDPSQRVLDDFGYRAGGWRVDRHPRMLADVSGEGRPDIVGFGDAGVWVAPNLGNGRFGRPRKAVDDFGFHAGGWRVDRHLRMLADLDGDGLADIVGFGDAGVWVARNRGDGQFERPRLVVPSFGARAGAWHVDRHPRYLADVTGDGRPDIVGFGDGGVWVARNRGDGTFERPQLALAEFGMHTGGWRAHRHVRLLADMTGDGRADIVGFGDAGVYVALARGDGSFEPARLTIRDFGACAGGWRVDRHPRLLADVTGDGRADIVGFGDAGVHVAVTTTLPAGLSVLVHLQETSEFCGPRGRSHRLEGVRFELAPG